MATVVLLGTLDTKGAEYDFVRQCLRGLGLDRSQPAAAGAAR